MKGLDKTTKVIAALGAIDLGLMTFMDADLVASIPGVGATIVYAIVGLAGIYALVKAFK